MSIKSKQYPIPPEGADLPPFAEDTLCWGCGRLFDMMEFIYGREGLCRKCRKIVKAK